MFFLLICGDIETQPGPNPDAQELTRLMSIKVSRIFHQNLRGLLSNFDRVKVLLKIFGGIDNFTVSETHINNKTFNENPALL